MAKIPFDIKFRPQIESGEYKVVTAKEQSVRIICWDRSTTYWKIIALVLAPDGETENPFTYDVNGKESYGCLHNHELDLFLITPEPELSEFEKRLSDVVGYAVSLSVVEPKKPTSEFVKEYSAELLDIARKELEPEIKAESLKDIEQDPESSYAFKRGVEYGKEEALKDLPRWREWEGGACGNSDGHPIALVSGAGGIRFVSVLGETGQKYIMLDDLKELPGFND